MGDFYILKRDPHSVSDTEFESIDPSYGPAPVCPSCGKFVGMMVWLPPRRAVVLGHGDYLGDVVYEGGDMIVSAQFVNCYRAEDLTGIASFEPVEIERSPSQLDLSEYYYSRVEFGGVRYDLDESSVVRSSASWCAMCGGDGVREIRRLVLDEATWRGEDVFRAWGFNKTVVSERLCSSVRRWQLRNVAVVPLREYTEDYGLRRDERP